MNQVKTRNILLIASVFAVGGGFALAVTGVYSGGLETLVIPDAFTTLLGYAGVTL